MKTATAILDFLYGEDVAWAFVLAAVAFGGGASYLAGRAVARAWGSRLILVFDALLIAAAVRFMHYALFEGTLLSLRYYAVDVILTLAAAGAGFIATRTQQMTRQYGFLIEHHPPKSATGG